MVTTAASPGPCPDPIRPNQPIPGSHNHLSHSLPPHLFLLSLAPIPFSPTPLASPSPLPMLFLDRSTEHGERLVILPAQQQCISSHAAGVAVRTFMLYDSTSGISDLSMVNTGGIGLNCKKVSNVQRSKTYNMTNTQPLSIQRLYFPLV